MARRLEVDEEHIATWRGFSNAIAAGKFSGLVDRRHCAAARLNIILDDVGPCPHVFLHVFQIDVELDSIEQNP